jgi:hypothetical protein
MVRPGRRALAGRAAWYMGQALATPAYLGDRRAERARPIAAESYDGESEPVLGRFQLVWPRVPAGLADRCRGWQPPDGVSST